LDEVGDMSLTTQAKLLRVLQNREIFCLGENEKINITTRVIAATNHDLENMVHTGLFRQDLFYRLNVFPIVLPSLRDRKEDIPELVSHFMKKYSIVGIDQEALALLMDMTDREMYENCKMSSNGQQSWQIKLSLCRISLLFNINKSCLFTNIKFQNTDSSLISLKNF
jgi:transcriptional regulator of acetoin/glycerol metabolism